MLAEGKGEYWLPFDADNIMAPQMIERLVTALRANPDCSAITCFFLAFEESRRTDTSPFQWAYRPTAGPFMMGGLVNIYGDASGMMRTRDLRQVGGYDEARGIILEDWHLYVKLACRGYEIEVLPEHLFYYRVRHDSMLRTGDLFPAQRRITNEYARAEQRLFADRASVWTALVSLRQQAQELQAQLHATQAQLRYRIANKLNDLVQLVPVIHRLSSIGARLLISGWTRLRHRPPVRPSLEVQTPAPGQPSAAPAPGSPPQPKGDAIDLAGWAPTLLPIFGHTRTRRWIPFFRKFLGIQITPE
jgi:hypothetical protein